MRPSCVSAAAWITTLALFAARGLTGADCNANGVEDAEEIASELARDCNLNSVPDDCDLDPTIAFSPGSTIDIVGAVTEPAIADLDGDGDFDAALVRKGVSSITEQRPARLAILRNAGDGTFSVTGNDLADDPGLVLGGDFDADGDNDLAFAGQDVRILLNKGDATFVDAPFVAGISGPRAEGVAADLDADDDLDIASLSGPALIVFLNDGRGGFAYRSQVASPLGTQASVAEGDVDGNRAIDLVLTSGSNRLLLLRNDGGASFEIEEEPLQGSSRWGVVVARLDFDEHPDLVLGADRSVRVELNTGDGTFPFDAVFSLPGVPPFSHQPHVAAFAADSDRDIDIVSTRGGRDGSDPRSGSATVLANDGDGNLRPAAVLPIEGGGFATAHPADLDGDLDQDLLIGNLDTGLLAVWRNESFGPASRDGNRDGVPDECSGRPFRRGDAFQNGVLNMGDAVFILDHLYQGGERLQCLEAADANDDAFVSIADPVYILNHLFLGGPAPPLPGPPPAPCGPDPETSPKLGCIQYAAGC